MANTKKISITNDIVEGLLFSSDNASKLIEESILFFVYAIESNILSAREVNRIFAQGLIKLK